jgi:hypothetical protein
VCVKLHFDRVNFACAEDTDDNKSALQKPLRSNTKENTDEHKTITRTPTQKYSVTFVTTVVFDVPNTLDLCTTDVGDSTSRSFFSMLIGIRIELVLGEGLLHCTMI